ncbi:MAG: hypothetical protein V3R85_05780 [Alphaproteobacteria bacterium]
MNPFYTLSRIVEHPAFRIFVFVLVIATATVNSLNTTIHSMAVDQAFYEKTPDPSRILGSTLAGILMYLIFISPVCIYRILKVVKVNEYILLLLLFLSSLWSYHYISGDFSPDTRIYDYAFIGEYWPIIREIAFSNTVTHTLYGAVLCVLIVRFIDTGRRLLTHLIAEAEARG